MDARTCHQSETVEGRNRTSILLKSTWELSQSLIDHIRK